MSYGAVIRQRVEALLTGESGTTRTLAAGRFHRRAPDRSLAQTARDTAERAVEVVLGVGRPLDGLNTLDSPLLVEHRLTVRVAYLVTHAGGDAGETLHEQSGAGTLDAVRDRALTDAFDIVNVLCWHENRAGTDPTLVAIGPDGDPALGEPDDGVAVLEIPFALTASATVPGAYAP